MHNRISQELHDMEERVPARKRAHVTLVDSQSGEHAELHGAVHAETLAVLETILARVGVPPTPPAAWMTDKTDKSAVIMLGPFPATYGTKMLREAQEIGAVKRAACFDATGFPGVAFAWLEMSGASGFETGDDAAEFGAAFLHHLSEREQHALTCATHRDATAGFRQEIAAVETFMLALHRSGGAPDAPAAQ